MTKFKPRTVITISIHMKNNKYLLNTFQLNFRNQQVLLIMIQTKFKKAKLLEQHCYQTLHFDICLLQWTEYEEQHKEASDWLNQTETLVRSYNKLQDSLEEKKNVLEQFQVHLQTLFDWQKELDRLNMRAQVIQIDYQSHNVLIFLNNIYFLNFHQQFY